MEKGARISIDGQRRRRARVYVPAGFGDTALQEGQGKAGDKEAMMAQTLCVSSIVIDGDRLFILISEFFYDAPFWMLLATKFHAT